MPEKETTELDCSELTDLSEAGLIKWADDNGLFAPADTTLPKQEPLVDPCAQYERHERPALLDELQERGGCPPGMASD